MSQINQRRNKEHQRQRRNQITISIVLVALMALSLFGIFASSGPGVDSINYNGHQILYSYETNSYITDVDGTNMNFYYSPQFLEYIDGDGFYDIVSNANFLVILFNPSRNDVQFVDVLRFDLGGVVPIFSAITKESNLYPNFPVLSCDNSTTEIPIVYLDASLNTTLFVNQTNSCITFSGSQQEILALRDRLMYIRTGIMDR